MIIYDVINMIINPDNVDNIADIMDGWEFQTSVRSQETIDKVKESAIQIAQMGEPKVYEHIKTSYGLKL